VTITRRILWQVALATGLVIAVGTAVTYELVFRATEQQGVTHLSDYVEERALAEQRNLNLVEQNLELARSLFLRRTELPPPVDLDQRWNARNELHSDGAWRTRRTVSDGTNSATMWIRKNAPVTPELKARLLRSEEVLNDLLLGWRDTFVSLYFIFPEQVNIGFDLRISQWIWEAKADYDTCAPYFFDQATPQKNPGRQIIWSQSSREPVSQKPYVSVTAPIYRANHFIGTVGHDIALGELLANTARSGIPDATHYLFRRDGKLIANPALEQRILDSNGAFSLPTSGDAGLQALYAAVNHRSETHFTGYLPESQSYFAASLLRGPDWFFVTLRPRASLRAQAIRSAQAVLWSGLGMLALMLGGFAVILRRQIAQPLAELARATSQISAGDTSFNLEPKSDDELGRLGAAFNAMATNVAERDAALRQEKNSLEQRVAERTTELTASESRFRTLVENAPEAIVVLDADTPTGLFVDVNRNAEHLFGLSRAELLKVGPVEMSPPVQPDGTNSMTLAQEKIGAALRGDTPTFEWTHRTAAGKDIACEIRLVQLPASGRNLVRGSVTDITERKRAEKRRTIFAGLGQRLSGATSIEGAMNIALDVADELFGWDSCSIDLYSAEQNATFAVLTMDTIEGQRVPVPPAYAGAAPSPFMQQIIERGAQLILRQPGESPAGLAPFGNKTRPSVSLMFVPMHNGARVTAILSLQSYTSNAYTAADLQIFQGLADYCSAAVERIQAEQEFRALFEHSLEGICRVTRDGRLLVANPAFARMLGFSAPADLMKAVADVGAQLCVAPPLWKQFLADLAGQSVIRRFDTEFRCNGAVHIHVTCSGHAVCDARSNVRYLAITIQDITERKRAEAELRNALARERELNELKSNFIAMVSHEFRTPLEVIVSSADILNRYLDRLSPADRIAHLESIQGSVQRMAGMMEDVLLLGRFERGRLECQPDDLHLIAWCRRLADEMRSATNGQCPIEVHLDLPDPMVRADEKLLRHILTNLISNAVKYSPPGSPVQLRVWRVGGEAVFEVNDRGCGIPPEDQPRLFEAFHRARNVGQIPGTGLGLVIVKRGVTLHGGRIEFTSEAGQGATFTVRLPLFDGQLTNP
jgi:PAS domain S-box-containing protein